jgi:hypothetical protein
VTAYWSGRNRSFTAACELAGEQMLETLLVHNQHDQIHAFDSNLQSPASAPN